MLDEAQVDRLSKPKEIKKNQDINIENAWQYSILFYLNAFKIVSLGLKKVSLVI
jgi:hypothetical protein